jgi:DNA-binding SARP family transcriptional activator
MYCLDMERKLSLFRNPRLEQDSISLETSRRETMTSLAYLALQTQRQSPDDLIALSWPARDHDPGRAALRETTTLLIKLTSWERNHSGLKFAADRERQRCMDVAA